MIYTDYCVRLATRQLCNRYFSNWPVCDEDLGLAWEVGAVCGVSARSYLATRGAVAATECHLCHYFLFLARVVPRLFWKNRIML